MSATAGTRERIVVLGFGPVAARLVEELLPAVAAGKVLLCVVGSERRAAYNRVLVADVGTGRTEAESIALADAAELTGHGVEVRLGVAAHRVDRARRTVLLSDGDALPYDRLVFATGAKPVVPVLRGLDFSPHGEPSLPSGVTALRDLDDAGALLPVVRSGGRVVVLGGGILGVEAALAVCEQGGRATLVHHGDIPLARALDHDGGRLLSVALRDAGVEVVARAKAVGVRLEGGRFAGLELADAPVVEGDLLVLSTGVRARDGLAEGCGLQVDRGIVVDRWLRADTEDRVFAIGDCAAVEGRTPSGLIGPGWSQAAWLAGYLVDHPAPGFPAPSAAARAATAPGATGVGADAADDVARGTSSAGVEPPPREAPGVILLKARGVDVAAGGDVSAGPWDPAPSGHGRQRVAVWADPDAGRYCKMATAAGVLTGFVAVGMPRTAAELVLLYERGAELPADRSTLFRLDDAASAPPSAPGGPEDVLCRCSGATHGQVEHAVGAGCSTVEEVGKSCRAGTGCGGCRGKIEALLAADTVVPA